MTKRKQIADAMSGCDWLSATMIAIRAGLHTKAVRQELSAMADDGFVARRAAKGINGWEFHLTGCAAKQGHIYMHKDRKVLALQSGESIMVAEVDEGDECWPLRTQYVCSANALQPLPMRYFHDQQP